MAEQQVVIITGCSSGIGLAVAVLLAKNNYKVYATMRNTSKSEELLNASKKAEVNENNLIVLELDVTSDTSVNNAINKVIAENGRVDVLINNAGFSKYGSVEHISVDEGKDQFETNFWGVVRCTQAVLPHMRKQKSGRILVTSSIGGVNGAPFNDIYCASKFAVEGLIESMAPVYQKLGIHIISIEPGATLSDFITNVQRPKTQIDDFNEMEQNVNSTFSLLFKYAQTSEEVAQTFLKAIQDEEPQLRYQTSKLLEQFVASKFKDNTGKEGVALARARYLEKPKQE